MFDIKAARAFDAIVVLYNEFVNASKCMYLIYSVNELDASDTDNELCSNISLHVAFCNCCV